MAGPSARRSRLMASLYGTYGEAATWQPQGGGSALAVAVRRTGGEDVIGFGDSQAIVSIGELRVRRTEIAAPEAGATVTILETGEVFKIASEPRLTKTGMEWLCEPVPVP